MRRVTGFALRLEVLLLLGCSAIWFEAILTHARTSSGQWASNIGLICAALYAGFACTHRAVQHVDRQRWAWALLAASAFSWASGQMAWTIYESWLGREIPFPSFADLGYLGALPPLFLGLLLLPRASLTTATQLRGLLDGLIVSISLLMLSWELVLGDTLAGGSGSWLTQAIGLAYPVGDVVSAALALVLVARLRHTSGMPLLPPLLLCGAVISCAVADSGFAFLTLEGTYFSGHPIDIFWLLGYFLLGFSARTSGMSASDPSEASEAADERRGHLGALAPYVAVVLALGAACYRELTVSALGPFMAWSLIVMTCLLVLRQVLTLRENLSLTMFLEARVRERTEALAEREQWFRSLVQNSSDVVSVVEVDGTITYQTPSAQRVFAFDPADMVGKQFTANMAGADASRLLQTLRDAAEADLSVVTVEACLLDAEGRPRDTELTITSLVADPHVRGLVINARDISERKALEAALAHQAFHDGLTGLANRALFRDRVEHALATHHRGLRDLAVLFLDLDGFKAVNDSYGHASGDRLLVQVGERLLACVRPGDTVSRLGGDEFAVLLERMDAEWNAEEVARRLLDALQPPFNVDDREILVRASIGIAVTESRDETAELLLRNADVAMYRAKAAGGSTARNFEPEMHAALVDRLEIETDLRRALAAGQFLLHFQPTIELDTGSVVGAEALIRWQHPSRGLIQPNDFIAIAEDTGQIIDIGAWVLVTACHWASRWRRRDPAFTVAVNVSGRQLVDGSFIDTVKSALAVSGLPAEALVLEMTESILIERTDLTIDLLHELKSLGVGLAIDDFGTGYSSLSYLGRFPVDTLKIDKSFVEKLGVENDDKVELTRAIVRLGTTMSLKTVAEGIEELSQLAMLRSMGCSNGQGFLFSRPVPAEELDEMVGRADGLMADERRLPQFPASRPMPVADRIAP